MIEIRGLAYGYPRAAARALNGVDLAVADGEFVVIAGASGSGKSTLAAAMTGLVPHVSGGTFGGSVIVAGRDTRTTPPRALAGVIGLVTQDPEAQSVVDRVEDDIAFGMENLGIDPVTMRKRLEEVLDALGIASLRARRLDTLSGGERQRVAIAGVLAMQPRALVLDEPTSQLDPQSAEDVLSVLQRLNADLGLTIVLVEHRLERVAQYADRICVLDDGRVVADGAPRDVFATQVLATPLSRIARALGWSPVPLSVREGRAFARGIAIDPAEPDDAPAGEPLVEARGIGVIVDGREILRDVDLRVCRGETVAIVGRNGAGKTTLVRALLGLTRVAAGARTIDGVDPARTPIETVARRAAYVPQRADHLLFCDTVADEIAFTVRARNAPDGEDVLATFGITALAASDPSALSAGQRMRVALAAVTAGDPPVVVLDEPTRGVDAQGKRLIATACARWRAQGRAVILVTHDVELVAEIATRVVVLAEGRVVVDGPVHEVLGASPLFSSQMTKVFDDRRILTVDDALAAVR